MSDKFVVDTSAWIEYLTGTKEGIIVEKILKDNLILIPSIVLAELTSKLLEKKVSEKIVEEIKKWGEVIELDEELAFKAGKLHAKVKKRLRNVSLADCIIIETAKKFEAKIITKDKHILSLYKNSIGLRS